MSDHEIPLAIGLLKGISWVRTYYNSGALLFNRVSSNYWAVIPGEKIQPVLVVNYVNVSIIFIKPIYCVYPMIF
jgi:hypothetical protein